MNTPRRDEIRSRIPEPRAIEEMIAFAGDAERLLRQVLPDYADEVEIPNGGKVCAEMTEKDVVMIRDFLSNVKVMASLPAGASNETEVDS
jgi:hypothetical protein